MSDRNLVLVVDDEEDIRDILGMQIEELEFEWIGAANGQEALHILESEPIDVIVSDVTMPKMNGIEFLRNCRLNGYEKPFIVLTGNGTKNTAMEALRLGAFDFLEKPFEPSHMKSLFADAMKTSKEQNIAGETEEFEKSSVYSQGLRIPNSTDSSADWEKGNNHNEFIEHFSNQLNFCKASVKGLVKKNQVPIELGYLFRIMRSLSIGAKHWNFYDLSSISFELTETLLYFRTNPSYLNNENIQLISTSVNNILSIFKALKQENTVIRNSFETKEKLFELNKKLGLVNSEEEDELNEGIDFKEVS